MFDNKDFDKWAGNYDESITLYLDKFPFHGYYDLLALCQSLVNPEPGFKVLDVGIGTGLLSQELYKQGCSISGVDFSEEMLGKAESKMPNGNFHKVDVARDRLGILNEQQFDRIISSYFFHHLDHEQKVSFLAQAIEKNLCENGKIIIADVGFETRSDYEKAHEKYKDSWDEDEHYLCGEEIVSTLSSEGIKMTYRQVNFCAGLLLCE